MIKTVAKIVVCTVCLFFLISCQSVNFDEPISAEKEKGDSKSLQEEQKNNEKQMEEAVVLEELKEVDIEKTVVYVEKPVYYPIEEKPAMPASGKSAAQSSITQAIQSPQKFTGGTMYYDFDESFIYEIYCQPYRITSIELEPGEMVLENPFLSESQVWEIGAGVAQKNGQDVQLFFLKPDRSNLITTMIIITNRRIYHFLLKSFKDCFMAMVKFEYPNTLPYNIKMDAINDRINARKDEAALVDPRFLSFDYKMTYSIFKKPIWLPKRVYDDGRRTYIELNELVLHSESPVLFNKRNERINYRVQKNLIIIDELIEKVTLRRAKEKVVIMKKDYKEEQKEVVVSPEENKTNETGKKGVLLRKNGTQILNGNSFGWEKK